MVERFERGASPESPDVRQDVKTLISSLSVDDLDLLLKYVNLPNKSSALKTLQELRKTYGRDRIRFISDKVEKIRAMHNINYDELVNIFKEMLSEDGGREISFAE